MNTRIVIASKKDYENIRTFYKEVGYDSYIDPNDLIIFAIKDNQEIVGVVRLSLEEDCLVLRGMRVKVQERGKGTGSKLLKAVNKQINGRQCYCLPFGHLEKFYNKIGFIKVELANAPLFLQKRFIEYKKKFPSTLIMVKQPE